MRGLEDVVSGYTIKHTLLRIGAGACAMCVSLAAQHMQTGLWRGLVFGLCVAVAYTFGRVRERAQ